MLPEAMWRSNLSAALEERGCIGWMKREEEGEKEEDEERKKGIEID